MKLPRINSSIFTRAGAVLLLSTVSFSASAIDWGGVQGKDIVVFYPGQASWEWALTQSDHSAAKKFREGKDCIECHTKEENDIGTKIVSGQKLEPNPIAGKPGSVTVNIKTAHDGEKLYVRFEWTEPAAASGDKKDPDYKARITMMLDDGHVAEAKRAGCWGTCHDDAVGMASAPPGKEITKYLAQSRSKVTRSGGGENYKPQADIDKLMSDGMYMEYWQAKIKTDGSAEAADGYILDKRHKNDAPAVEAQIESGGGKTVVTLSRKLTGVGPHHKDLAAGKTYNIGFAIHADHTDHRYHYVSFSQTLVLDQGSADFVAVKK
jgi:cytochrome c-type protein NapC